MSESFASSWEPCLGQVLDAGTVTSLKDPCPLDLLEVELRFRPAKLIRYLGVDQTREGWEISASVLSGLAESDYPRKSVEHYAPIAAALGSVHTGASLFVDDMNDLAAVVLDFPNCSFVLALGRSEWLPDEKRYRFEGFVGDDLYVWDRQEFATVLRDHPLTLARKMTAI